MLKISVVLLLVAVPAIFAGAIGEVKENNDKVDHALEVVDDYVDIAGAALSCNLNYACYKGRHYYFETKTKRTRDDAANFCRVINMSLVVVDDCGEDTFITNAIKDNDCYKNYFWTAGYRTDSDVFYWSNGDSFKFTNWMRAEPNYGKNQYCVAYHSGFVQWSDEVCSNKNFFICESNNACA